jgi:hypothetical protein
MLSTGKRLQISAWFGLQLAYTSSTLRSRPVFRVEYGGSRFLRSVGTHPPNYTAQLLTLRTVTILDAHRYTYYHKIH